MAIVRYTDAEIEGLIAERKELPVDYRAKLQPRAVKRGQLERELPIVGEEGTPFTIIVRQSASSPLRFSVVLSCPVPGLTTRFLLRRYNGDHGTHTNRIERNVVRGTHIHLATQRYQEAGFDEEAFAVEDPRFVDLYSAVDCMIADCSFVSDDSGQQTLFGGPTHGN